MRIKRFVAADMRTALRMVRAEQGADAVILSNRACEGGIEVVSATDYDEALVNQALRAAAPSIATLPAANAVATLTSLASATQALEASLVDAPLPAEARETATVSDTAANDTRQPASAPSVRETLASRARAVFRIGEDSPQTKIEAPAPTLAQLTRTSAEPNRFESMMAALAPTHAAGTDASTPLDEDMRTAHPPLHDDEDIRVSLSTASKPLSQPLSPSAPSWSPATHASAAEPARDVQPVAMVRNAAPSEPKLELSLEPLVTAVAPRADDRDNERRGPLLHSVPRWDADPTVAVMREELSSMRLMIERELGQFGVERMKGSPARAAVFEALLGYGCDEALAQTIAAKIDPSMDPAKVRAPMLAELARMITISRNEPIDAGGVIALIGPTGAGKTTTAAKLAARFASRHRARDVALVTTDAERIGAREQLHAHGRKLGITVCEAHGPEALAQTLEQLQDYPLVVVDTAGFGARDRALLGQITWLRATRNVRNLLVLPANAHPHDMNEVVRRYRIASPEGVVLTKIDETGRLGAALSTVIHNGLSLAYTTDGQEVSTDLAHADASHLVLQLEKLRRAADNPLATEDRHVAVS